MKNEGNDEVNPQPISRAENKKLSKLRRILEEIDSIEGQASELRAFYLAHRENDYARSALRMATRRLARLRERKGRLEVKIGAVPVEEIEVAIE